MFLKEILDAMENIIQNPSTKPKAWFYAAHDVNIVVILMCLNNFNYRTPKYVANLAFELHQILDLSYAIQVGKNTPLISPLSEGFELVIKSDHQL